MPEVLPQNNGQVQTQTQTVTNAPDSARLVIMALFLSTGFVSELLQNKKKKKNAK